MNIEDQRVIRTRRQLQESFITLVNEGGFDSVSIRDVTAHAEVGYRTFFRHYKDTRQLLEDALSDFIDEVSKLLLPPESEEMTEQNVIIIFQFIGQNAELFRAFYRSPLLHESNVLMNFGWKVSRSVLSRSSIPGDIIEAHFLYSMANLQRWWVEQGMPISAEQMGRYAHDLIVRPILLMPDQSPAAPQNEVEKVLTAGDR